MVTLNPTAELLIESFARRMKKINKQYHGKVGTEFLAAMITVTLTEEIASVLCATEEEKQALIDGLLKEFH